MKTVEQLAVEAAMSLKAAATVLFPDNEYPHDRIEFIKGNFGMVLGYTAQVEKQQQKQGSATE